MKFRPPPMQPAFSGTGHIVVWIAALAAILLSPILTALVVSPETRYLVMSKRVGPSDWHTEQVLKETGPLDILVLGNSRMLVAIDHAALREYVQTPDGPLKSETIAARFNGYDLSYTFLKDFFIHRRARLVIINYPDIPQIDSHPGEKYIRTLGQPDPIVGAGSGFPGILTPFESHYEPTDLLAFGLGGNLTMQFSQPMAHSRTGGSRNLPLPLKTACGHPL